MDRINGFLNIDGYFEQLLKNTNLHYDDLYFDGYIIPKQYNDNHFLLHVEGKEYYFKPTRNIYEELIVSECAKFLDIDAVEYDLAVFNGIEGVISENYKKENNNYIPGVKILYDYFRDDDNKDVLKEMGLNFENVEECYNSLVVSEAIQNLEVIWQALEYRYKNDYHSVENIMHNLLEHFMLNMLIGQKDGHPLNWEVEESLEGNKLVPYYDGGESFDTYETPHSYIAVSYRDKGKDNYAVFEEFLKISSSDFIESFVDKFERLGTIEFYQILRKVENKIGIRLPYRALGRITNAFEDNREMLEKILGRYKRGAR